MRLIVHELKSTPLYQKIKPSRNTIVEAIRPHLVKFANPSGSLKLQIQDSEGNVIAESESLTITDLSEATYSHGKYRFYINAHLKKDTTYRVALLSEGYSFSEAAYVGWCNSYDLSSYDANYTPSTGYSAPLSLEVFERKKR